MYENNQAPYQKGKKKREQLRLPQLHFIAADDWMDQLGYEGFGVWLKFHTWVDRKNADREYDKIPMSLEASWEKLGISKSKFYRLIRPMWEFGLIDIIDYEASKRIGQKPKNIIVYEYPFHDETRMFKPLEKLRDWEKDYQSKSKEAGMIGGRPRKLERQLQDLEEEEKQEKPIILHRFKIKTVDRFKIKTVTVSKLKRNNVLNNSINVQITPSNVQIKNLSILESIKALDLPSAIISLLEKKIDRLMLHQIDLNEIEILFHQNREQIGHSDFISILNDVLMAEKYNYGFKRYMAASIKNYLTNREDKVKAAGQPAKPVRKEESPDWLEKQKQQEAQQQDLDQDEEEMDFEAEKRKLEEELKKFKKNK